MKKNFLFFLLLIWLSQILFTGCSPFQPQQRAPEPAMLPKTFTLYDQNATIISGAWWNLFDDPELERLVDLGLSRGFDIRQAWARLDQARAQAVQAGAALYPELEVEGSTSHTRQKLKNSGTNQDRYSTSRSNTLGLAAGYELDLWGRVRSKRQAELLTANATLEDVRTAAMTLSGEIAEAWINILALREQRRVIERQLKVNEQILDLLRFRFMNSLATALDVLQQEETVAGSKAALPDLRARENVLLNQLAVLVGKMPGQIRVEGDDLPHVPPVPKTGLPADLLALRPDIRAAGLRLEAADWSVAAARADRLPALRLTARGEFFAEQAGNIFQNWLADLTASVTGPLFDAGRRRAEVERSRAVVRERLAAYESVVAQALSEVQNALSSGYMQTETISSLRTQLQAAGKSHTQAEFRYRNGLVEYNVVLTELLNVQWLEQQMVQARAELLLERVRLGRALGGSWTLDILPSRAAFENQESALCTMRRIYG